MSNQKINKIQIETALVNAWGDVSFSIDSVDVGEDSVSILVYPEESLMSVFRNQNIKNFEAAGDELSDALGVGFNFDKSILYSDSMRLIFDR